MDLQKIISDLLAKLKIDGGLLEKFKKNPIETVKSLLGGKIDLNADQLKTVVDGISAKLGVDEIARKGGGLLARIKSLFGGK